MLCVALAQGNIRANNACCIFGNMSPTKHQPSTAYLFNTFPILFLMINGEDQIQPNLSLRNIFSTEFSFLSILPKLHYILMEHYDAATLSEICIHITNFVVYNKPNFVTTIIISLVCHFEAHIK